MRYSNGFFVFCLESEFMPHETKNSIASIWSQEESIEGYERYEYHWCLTYPDQLRKERHYAPVWLHRERSIAIVFLTNHLLLDEVRYGIYKKFGYTCSLYPKFNENYNEITNRDVLWICRSGENQYHQVKTNLISNDQERMDIIEELLAGGYCENTI